MVEINENNTNTKPNHGYVYILSNPSMPGLLKIGMTRFDPSRRVQELSSATGVPTPFQLIYYREFNNCVAAEFEAHSILAAKGLRYNDQREFFSIDTVEAINTILSLQDEDIEHPLINTFEVENYNEDIDWNEYFRNRRESYDKIQNSAIYVEGENFIRSSIMYKYPCEENALNKMEKYIEQGLYRYIPIFVSRLHLDDVEERINLIISYTQKGYISGYIDCIQEYLESVDGIENLPSEKKMWVAEMLDKFAKQFRNASAYDLHIHCNIIYYCGISRLLGLQYDKSMLKALDLDDDYSDFNETWIWGTLNTSEENCKKLGDMLRTDKDQFCGTSSKLRFDIVHDNNYKKFHDQEGYFAYVQGCKYAYGIDGTEKNAGKAHTFLKAAIDKNYKKAYLPLAFLHYQDKEEWSQIVHTGAADSCPQCLMQIVDRMLINTILEEDLTKSMRNKIFRYLDLFISQIDIAFWVDAEECLNAIKIFIICNIAFQRKFKKEKIKAIIEKIKAVVDIEQDSLCSDISLNVSYYSCFYDSDLIEQEAILTMKELIDM